MYTNQAWQLHHITKNDTQAVSENKIIKAYMYVVSAEGIICLQTGLYSHCLLYG